MSSEALRLWLIAMAALVFASAFFSSSEAALFYLDRGQRRRMASGTRAQRLAAGLLADPDRLLTAVLFWNLLVNVAYFTITSIVSLGLEREGRGAEAGLFALAALMTMIVCSEMLPKSLAVLRPTALATLWAVPLSLSVRALDPVRPAIRTANLLARRLFVPRFEPEPYLRVGDLERAVELSTDDAALLEQEQRVLQNIVSLSDIRAEELMRPRVRLATFRPPVALSDLEGRLPPSGYLLLTEADGEEIAGAIPLRELSHLPNERLERFAEPVACVPWCATVAAALETMRRLDRPVAAVVNEHGETIGVLTNDDVLDVIFRRDTSRSERIERREPIRAVAEGVWHVSGMTGLRRLVRQFGVERPPSKSVTVAGVVQEVLERMPEPGDRCRWGPFSLRVLDVPQNGPQDGPQHGQMLVELTLAEDASTWEREDA